MHDISQIAVGWTDSHLFEFVIGDHLYGEPMPDDDYWDRQVYKAANIRLRALIERGVERFLYVYDFGDDWRRRVDGPRDNLILVGPTGIGKSFLSCALVERACRRGLAARYVRMPRLLHELAVGRGDGSYTRLLARLAKLDLLAIDDWMLAPLRDPERRDLTEVIEDRAERASTLIASQLPVHRGHRLARRHRQLHLDRRPAAPLSLSQVDPLIRQLTVYRDLIDRRTGDPS